MSRIRFAPLPVLSCMALMLALGCRAQNQPAETHAAQPASASTTAETNRQIELTVRSQFNVPADYAVTVGPRSQSDMAGFDSIDILLSRNGKSTTVHFFISADNKTLARLEKFDLTNNPSEHISIDNRPIRGNPKAKVTVINFDDLECPYCARMHADLFPRTLDRYKDKVRFVYRDYPLVEIHPWAMHASINANCLGAQSGEAYWDYVDYLHAHGQEVEGEKRDPQKSFEVLNRIATEQGTKHKLDQKKLDACVAAQDPAAVHQSMAEGRQLGIDGTPSLYINGEHLAGAVPAEELWMVIDRALVAAGVQPPGAEDAPAAAPTAVQTH